MEPKMLLWTSGWDSTFRLLELLLQEKQIVQPVYIIDHNRLSLANELKAIEQIVDKIQKDYPEAGNQLLPVKYYDKDTIVIDPEISQAFEFIRTKINLGSQYNWLSSLCKQENFKNIELSIHKDDTSNFVFDIINPELKTNLQDELTDTEQQKMDNSVNTLFKYYEFPLFNTNKKEMLEAVNKNGWMDIMKLTWFCHRPKNNKPCGKCKPCLSAIRNGLEFRIPLKNRLKGYFKIMKQRYF